MPNFDNTWKTHPHMTQLLETEIYKRRKRTKGMSQHVLANKIGVSRNAIYLMESHKHIPRIETILEIMWHWASMRKSGKRLWRNIRKLTIRTRRFSRTGKKNGQVCDDGGL